MGSVGREGEPAALPVRFPVLRFCEKVIIIKETMLSLCVLSLYTWVRREVRCAVTLFPNARLRYVTCCAFIQKCLPFDFLSGGQSLLGGNPCQICGINYYIS